MVLIIMYSTEYEQQADLASSYLHDRTVVKSGTEIARNNLALGSAFPRLRHEETSTRVSHREGNSMGSLGIQNR